MWTIAEKNQYENCNSNSRPALFACIFWRLTNQLIPVSIGTESGANKRGQVPGTVANAEGS